MASIISVSTLAVSNIHSQLIVHCSQYEFQAMSIQKMQRYVLGWVGLLVAFAATYPIAMQRVSQTDKFVAQPLNSNDCAGATLKSRQVVEFSTCAQMKVKPVAQH
jgi:hypothetical protein